MSIAMVSLTLDIVSQMMKLNHKWNKRGSSMGIPITTLEMAQNDQPLG